MEKKSKNIVLNYYQTTQDGLKKRQYKVTLPVRMVTRLNWKPSDELKVWINSKRHIEIRKHE